jgi:hypothetical protein
VVLFLKCCVNLLVTYSHKGFLSKYLKHLKDMKFLREDLVFSTHSKEVIFSFFLSDFSFTRLSYFFYAILYMSRIGNVILRGTYFSDAFFLLFFSPRVHIVI